MSKKTEVKVHTTENVLELTITSNTTGQQLYDEVVGALDLVESWYFGLQFRSNKGDLLWLKSSKKVKKQDVKVPLQFFFRAKFFPRDINELTQEMATRLFYLQLKESILIGSIICPPETAVMLASFACQEKYGDHNPNIYSSQSLAKSSLLPGRIYEQYTFRQNEIEEKIIELWNMHKGMSCQDAMSKYLNLVQDLDMYGVTYFDIKNKKGTDIVLGVDILGLNIYEKENLLMPKIGFSWKEMNNISFMYKKCSIKLRDKKSPSFSFYAQSLRHNKKILDLCSGYYDLYSRLAAKRDKERIDKKKATEMEQKEKERLEKERLEAERADIEKRRREVEDRLDKLDSIQEETTNTGKTSHYEEIDLPQDRQISYNASSEDRTTRKGEDASTTQNTSSLSSASSLLIEENITTAPSSIDNKDNLEFTDRTETVYSQVRSTEVRRSNTEDNNNILASGENSSETLEGGATDQSELGHTANEEEDFNENQDDEFSDSEQENNRSSLVIHSSTAFDEEDDMNTSESASGVTASRTGDDLVSEDDLFVHSSSGLMDGDDDVSSPVSPSPASENFYGQNDEDETQTVSVNFGTQETVEDYQLVMEEDEGLLRKNQDNNIQKQLRDLSVIFEEAKDESKMDEMEKLLNKYVSQGRDKYKTLKRIRTGNTKRRIDEFESW